MSTTVSDVSITITETHASALRDGEAAIIRPNNPDSAAEGHCVERLALRRVLRINGLESDLFCDDDGRSLRDIIWLGWNYEPQQIPAEVSVTIGEFTSKETAVALVEKILASIKNADDLGPFVDESASVPAEELAGLKA